MIRLNVQAPPVRAGMYRASNDSGRARVASRIAILGALAIVSLLCLRTVSPAFAQAPLRAYEHWVGTWATAPVQRPQTQTTSGPAPPAQPPPNLANSTIREIVHVSLAGNRARVLLTNAFGSAPLTVGAASVAVRDKGSNIAGSSHPLTFAGRPSVTIPAGAMMLSDPVSMAIPAMGDLAIDLFLPAEMLATTSPLTIHGGAFQTNYISKQGNFAGSADFPVASTTASWYFLSRVEIAAAGPASAIIAFGDSITDGTRSTPNTNNRWPDLLVKRLAAAKGAGIRAILNEAIAGNRLLTESTANFGINALARFDRDVLDQPGATHLIVLEGINDIGMGRAGAAPSSDELIAAHQQLIERAHAHGLKIIGATLTPFEGAAYFTADGETKRQAINAWIRGGKAPSPAGSPRYDGVIDFDAATRDPQNLTKFNPQYDSGDHLHPNDAGYQAMAAAIDLKLFESSGRKR